MVWFGTDLPVEETVAGLVSVGAYRAWECTEHGRKNNSVSFCYLPLPITGMNRELESPDFLKQG